ncbi:IS200/IS605 family transposase [Candidatus Micrarchaeota archaeon CG08_land_8_20_14_0_20_49_17]|nr:MAG: IS200/IS605 family transposase [Candidatus Micrarchaeota archaeon CG1_02_49_24]PIU10016.1 MAG: IS200/IS605 family transposase [Candidatus Micrarchaeota archaeon CG08_land_8_20_14_0_20_49_17]HII53629.1 IS200/IS605 family transposase [Candidatus Micrarchaeota archaeon]
MEKTTSSAKYNINYHSVWCPKYRREILIGERTEFLNLVLHNVAKENDWEILELKIMPDHIHLFLSAPPKFAPTGIVQRLKGRSSREMFLQFPLLKTILRKGKQWSPSYYVGTAGHVSEETIRRYIQEQEKGRNSSSG